MDGRKKCGKNHTTSPRSAESACAASTHPRVGQAERLACRKRQPNAFLRAEARTHFFCPTGPIDNFLITLPVWYGYPQKFLVCCRSRNGSGGIPNFYAEVMEHGSPNQKPGRTRNQVIAFRVTPAEARKIREKVRRSGLSQQEYLLRAALEQQILAIHELKPILTELRAWGKNLNQLTVLAHTGHVQTVYLNELTEALGKTYEALNGLLTEKGTVVSSGDL